jgi:hypothetical protein
MRPPADLPRPAPGESPGGTALDRSRCQVGGTNQNYTSRSGTLYHIQIEDRGPVLDRVSEQEVRRLSLIVYANYGEPNARIVHGADHDFPDLRTHEHNRFIEQRIQELAAQCREVIEEKEDRQVARIKTLVREYYATKNEATKREFEQANVTFPFVFSRAWLELKADKGALAPASAPSPRDEADVGPDVVNAAEEVVYPLDDELRERVIEIERLIIALGQDIQRLKAQGGMDDILLQTCRKLVTRAKESLSGREPAEFSVRRLDMTRNSLMTTWRQVRSRLK